MIYISKGIKGLSLNSKQLISGLFLVSLLGLMPIFSSPLSACVFQEKTPLAGEPVFSKKEYNDWLRKQRDPSLETEVKIKSTVNTFFLAKYESWVSGKLLDFEFLFDRVDSQAQEDYVYERGLMHYLLEGWKYIGNLLSHYEYEPKFYDLKIEGKKATVMMRPKAGIVHRKTPDVIDNGPWTDYIFKLEFVSDQWLIKSIRCNDELHEIYPHGTDFEQLTLALPDKIKAFNDAAEAEHREKMQNDPKYREFIERRRKQQQERFSQQRKNEEKRLQVYHEIAGDYRFIIEEKTVHVSFYVQDRYLMGKRENESEGIVLQRIEGNPMEFKFRSPDGYVYELRFLRDENGTIEKCLMSKEGEEYKGLKVKELNISFLCLRCKIPNRRSMDKMV
jgi:hypothetical protein